MAKTPATQAAAAPEGTAATIASLAVPAAKPFPVMGQTVMVQAAPGSLLINNETGGFFAEGVPTPHTVTVTLLRRLQDGDLVLL